MISLSIVINAKSFSSRLPRQIQMVLFDTVSLAIKNSCYKNIKPWLVIYEPFKKGAMEMTGLTYPLMCFLYFVCVGLDIAMFFLQIRLVVLWRNVNWLVPFDNAGKTLVNAVTAKVSQCFKPQNPLSER